MQDDSLCRGELTHLLGGGIDSEPIVDLADAVARSVEHTAQPLRLWCADVAPDAGLRTQGVEGR